MQTKKRAKAVKFGDKKPEAKAIKDKKVEHSEPEKPEKVTEAKIDKEASEIVAHYSSTKVDIDISDENPEIAPDEKLEGKEDVKKQQEAEQEDMAVPVEPEASEDVVENATGLEQESQEHEPLKHVEEENTEDINKTDFFNAPPDKYDKKNSALPYFFMVMTITFILGIVFFAGIFYAVSNKSAIMSFVSRPTPTVAQKPPEVVPTEIPIDLSKFSISILNGTSKAGVAAKLKEQLTTEGFKVDSVGNAKSSDFEKTEISASKEVDKKYLEKLKATLEKIYILENTIKTASGAADVVITIGSQSAR